MNLLKDLKERFGYTHFRIGQRDVIESVLNGNDTIAMLPTGTGKSLCYQLAGYRMDGHVLIVSPLLSLMQDQVEQMKVMGEKRVIALNSFLSFSERKKILRKLTQFKFIFISPEMVMNPTILEKLTVLDISLYVIDEAHCISQWGPDFRPDYMKLGTIRKKFNQPIVLALTATATEYVRSDIKKTLNIHAAKEYVYSIDRPNIGLMVKEVQNHEDKMLNLLEIVKKLKKPGIIYFSSKRLAEETSEWLKDQGLTKTAYYHGGMDQEQRILIQQQFLYNKLNVICATSAFGMGINKENVRFVIHFHMPTSIESYLQEIGRAGRDGMMSLALLLYCKRDEQLPLQIVENELPSNIQIEEYLKLIMGDKRKTKDSLELTDIQERFINYYHDYFINRGTNDILSISQKIINIRDGRTNYKKEKIVEFLLWITGQGCKRSRLVSLFDESKSETIPNCCDWCGLTFEQYESKEDTNLYEEDTSWQEQLKKILLPV
ncbi:ATP-dependent DNA helicase RecQ [Bacillus pakistanensis]|uniref:ATP-dependent DNA helicase RecQ n=1 Tax=Rossellomorea pakistanensis TaxID=992288 RepID=A0ABS2N9E9_9BACI|nr:ATP-dependent DNA helicase RecQ [Bacillus pakistanensis]MBM7584389.1 ATP-dependent DNA helicase RecQ [Bacillus pakistanensis]